MSYRLRCIALIWLQSLLLVFAARPDWPLIVGSALLLLPFLRSRTRTFRAPLLRNLVMAAAILIVLARIAAALTSRDYLVESIRLLLGQLLPWSIPLQVFLIATAREARSLNRPLTILSLLTLLGSFLLLSVDWPASVLQAMVVTLLPLAIWLLSPPTHKSDEQIVSYVQPPTDLPAVKDRRNWLIASGYLIGIWAARTVWDSSVRQAQAAFPTWVATLSGQRTARRAYVRTGTLTSVTREQFSEPMQIALRVYSKRPPGYLRGRIFDTFERSQWYLASSRRGKWNQSEGRNVRTPLGRRPPGLATANPNLPIFLMAQPTEGPFVRMEIHNDPARDEVFFIPPSSAYLQGDGSFLATDAYGVIHTGIRTDHPYTAFVARHTRPEMLSPEMRARLVLVPTVPTDLTSLANTICHDAQTTDEKVRAIVRYFHANYSYSDQGLVIPAGTDPLVYFLVQRPAAHCEYFATAAAVLLRAMQIPCRYVTGYVVTELEPEFGDYWVARNRNAHAWAEAFDEERQRWILVEATPGMRLPESNLTARVDLSSDATDSGWQVDMLAARSNWLRRLRGTSVGPLLLLTLAATLLFTSGWKRFQATRQLALQNESTRTLRRRQNLLRSFEKWLARRGYKRESRQTLHQFAAELRGKNEPGQPLDACAQWLERYALLRYAPDSLADSAMTRQDADRQLEDQFRELRRGKHIATGRPLS